MFYVFLWVIPGRLNFICRRLGTLCSIFIGGYLSAYKDGRDRVFRNVGIFRRRGITQKKAYNIQNTANVWNQEHFNIILLSSSRFPRDFLLGILRGFSSSLRICIYHLSQFSQIGTKYELSTQTTQFFLSSHWYGMWQHLWALNKYDLKLGHNLRRFCMSLVTASTKCAALWQCNHPTTNKRHRVCSIFYFNIINNYVWLIVTRPQLKQCKTIKIMYQLCKSPI